MVAATLGSWGSCPQRPMWVRSRWLWSDNPAGRGQGGEFATQMTHRAAQPERYAGLQAVHCGLPSPSCCMRPPSARRTRWCGSWPSSRQAVRVTHGQECAGYSCYTGHRSQPTWRLSWVQVKGTQGSEPPCTGLSEKSNHGSPHDLLNVNSPPSILGQECRPSTKSGLAIVQGPGPAVMPLDPAGAIGVRP